MELLSHLDELKAWLEVCRDSYENNLIAFFDPDSFIQFLENELKKEAKEKVTVAAMPTVTVGGSLTISASTVVKTDADLVAEAAASIGLTMDDVLGSKVYSDHIGIVTKAGRKYSVPR